MAAAGLQIFQSGDTVFAKGEMLKLLECPVCLNFMDGNIFQCESGHPACHVCKQKLKKGCPSCTKPFLKTRNLPLEHVAEQVYRPCSNDGCQDLFTTSQQKEHPFHCKHREVQCPSCKWMGSMRKFAIHIESAHHDGKINSLVLEKERPMHKLVDAAAVNVWNSWYKIDRDNTVFHFRLFISDVGCSWFCCRVFGSRSVAAKYRYKLELKSVAGKSRKGAQESATTIVQNSSFCDDVHSDLDQEDEKCIPLVKYEALQKWGLINKENKLTLLCTVLNN